MKIKINKKNRKSKFFLKFLVILIFTFFICSALVLSKRKYLYIESGFKTLSSIVNSYVIEKAYSNNKLEDYVLNTKYEYLQSENNRLRQLLDINSINENVIIAEVTNKVSSNWFKKIVINKGFKDGVKNDLPVVNSNGVIGFITKTSKNISEISLLTNVSEDNMVSVIIESKDGNYSGILSSYDSKKDLFIITDVMAKTPIAKGDSVILSGYNNNLYKGLYIGEVVKEESSNYGLTKTLRVKSKVDFNDILFVAIFKEEIK